MSIEGNCRIWSIISATSGDTTTVSPGSISEGSWNVNDLPPPVGSSSSADWPRSTRSTAHCWPVRKPRKPQTRRSSCVQN